MRILKGFFFLCFVVCSHGLWVTTEQTHPSADSFFVGVFVFAFAAGVADTLHANLRVRKSTAKDKPRDPAFEAHRDQLYAWASENKDRIVRVALLTEPPDEEVSQKLAMIAIDAWARHLDEVHGKEKT